MRAHLPNTNTKHACEVSRPAERKRVRALALCLLACALLIIALAGSMSAPRLVASARPDEACPKDALGLSAYKCGPEAQPTAPEPFPGWRVTPVTPPPESQPPVLSDAECNSFCREYHGTSRIHGPEAEGKVENGVCNCHCKSGYEPDETLTCVKVKSKTKSCDETCKDQRGPHTDGQGNPPNCICSCKKGYEQSNATGKCEESCTFQCKKTYGWAAFGRGDPVSSCECKCLYPWKLDSQKAKCVESPRNIGMDDLEEFLQSRGYSEKNCPRQGNPPAGSIKLWDFAQPDAHSSMVMLGRGPNGQGQVWQIQMGGYRNASGVIVSDIVWPTAGNPQADPPPPSGLGQYTLKRTLCPPANAFVYEDCVKKMEGIPRYGELQDSRHPEDDWNCHGFSASTVAQCVETFARVRPDTNVNWPQMLEIGAIHGYTPTVINVPQGPVKFYSQFTIEARPDHTTIIHVFEGKAEYQGDRYSLSLSSGQTAVIDPNGVPSTPTTFEISEIDKWWEDPPKQASEARSLTGLAVAGVCLVIMVGALAVVVAVVALRPRPAAGALPYLAPVRRPYTSAARLDITRGNASVPFVNLSGRVITIGREASSALVLNDARVSRKHARVEFENGMWVICDLNSSNGTFVNRIRISKQALHPGDQIQIGEAVLVFRD